MVRYSGEKVHIHVYISDSNTIISYLYQRHTGMVSINSIEKTKRKQQNFTIFLIDSLHAAVL